MPGMFVRAAAVAALVAFSAPLAVPQVPAHNRANFDKTWARIVEIFEGQDKLQAAYEEARAEQARTEGALQLSLNLEARFRANNSLKNADSYLNAANSLRPTVESLRTTFARFDALDTPLDEARGKAAYDRVAAELAAIYQRPMTEQFEYAKALTLKQEPLVPVQTAANTLLAVAGKKPAEATRP